MSPSGSGSCHGLPLVWMIGASFMTNEQIFSSVSCIPRFPTLSGYKKGFEGYQGMTLLHFMVNTYKFVIPKVLFTVASATLTAYGFARFNILLANVFLLQYCCPHCFCLR